MSAPRSAAAEAYRRLYRTSRWQRLRLAILARDLYRCSRCGVALYGQPPALHSPVVNHRIPHRGDLALFWDEANLEAVCKGCHDRDIQAEELNGYHRGVGPDGFPVDPNHPWNRR